MVGKNVKAALQEIIIGHNVAFATVQMLNFVLLISKLKMGT